MKIENLHTLEKQLRKRVETEQPNHPCLGVIYHSTQAAIDAYNEALKELNQ